MLWQKGANNIYVNICQDDLDDHLFEKARVLLGFQILPTKSDFVSLKKRTVGNTFFAAKQWSDAITKYNSSLCFAKNGSENISLAYANRSACFLHLKMYDKCLADIQLAIEANYPERLMSKLEARRAVCLEQRNIDPVDIAPELSFEADDKFPCMANVLHIQHSEEFGRHITAKSDIAVGKIVVKENAVLPVADQYKRCNTCWKTNVNLIPCTKCTAVLFCSGRCKQSQFHNIQCGMRIIDEEYVNEHQMNLVRSVLMAIHEFSDTDDLIHFVEAAVESDAEEIPSSLLDNKSKYRAFLKLKFDRRMHEKDTFPTQVCFAYKTLINHRDIKPQFSSKKDRRFLMHLVGHHLCTIQCNTGALMRNSDSRFNVAQNMSEHMSILVNFINHSCAPNVSIITVNNVNVCITLRPIKTGDQLFVSYFRNDPLKHCTADRRQYLRDICDFYCNCEQCVPPTAVPKELAEMKADASYKYVRKYGNKMDCCTRYGRNEGVLRLCSCSIATDEESKKLLDACIEFLNKYGQMKWTTELDFVVNCYANAVKGRFDQ